MRFWHGNSLKPKATYRIVFTMEYKVILVGKIKISYNQITVNRLVLDSIPTRGNEIFN